MNMTISVSSTSISGVTLICARDGPPPAIEKAIGNAPLGHARVCRIRHLTELSGSVLAGRESNSPPCLRIKREDEDGAPASHWVIGARLSLHARGRGS